jgi:hydroxylamine reductase
MADNKMFCFQCEQTIGCTGCTGAAGTCGKKAETAGLQDELTGSLISLAKAYDGKIAAPEVDVLVMEGMFTCITNVNFDDAKIQGIIDRVRAATVAAGGVAEAYDMNQVWNAHEDVRSLKSLILFGLRGMCAYAYHAAALGYTDAAANAFTLEALRTIGSDASADDLLACVLKVGEVNLSVMELLDKANTETYGTPAPTKVGFDVEAGPFIAISGHDLHDLKLLLEQTEGRGVNVYTHGEMLPAHAYPELAKFKHLKGNVGTAWQNQRKEFAELPGAFLFTTNCLMPPTANYADRVFTTGPVQFAGCTHIGDDKDFEPVIQKAIEMGGFPEKKVFTGHNGGTSMTTGFGHGAVLGVAPAVIDAVKNGDISRFILVAGCDGIRKEREYYTDLVKQAPADSVILTLACGKYRFNDLDLGEIGGIPRLLDVGQCNDAYGAIKIALALAEAFECGVNDLPLTMVLSWYEQKAVCILLTLLHLGIKGIYLGPTLPAFVSPGVLNTLVEAYGITPTSTPEADLAKIFA